LTVNDSFGPNQSKVHLFYVTTAGGTAVQGSLPDQIIDGAWPTLEQRIDHGPERLEEHESHIGQQANRTNN
jgi:hypothetical protein